MKVDPRYISSWLRSHKYRFKFSVNGRTLTITRTDEDGGWRYDFWLRTYLPTDTIPDFTSTVYTYYGLDHEGAPYDVTEVIFAPSVTTTIKERAFYDCKSLVRITIPDHMTHIETFAFMSCDSLRFIRLSTNLVYIGYAAFYDCKSLEAVYLPPTITRIGDSAFRECALLRSFHMPEISNDIGNQVFEGCKRLLATINIDVNLEEYEDEDDVVIQRLMQQYANLPFHQACFNTSVNPQRIQGCVQQHRIERATEVDDQQMTALHILCANPHVTGDCIRAYLQLVPATASIQKHAGKTGLHILCTNPALAKVTDGGKHY